ncbi:uncharacterized protein [Rutidosis leptorrhynchoides]|uniref:uncharacterized protein n=1 Tax=Rutidosis leptorrhynchoides TaxID=125765 RepID=UPI003A9989CF
MYEDPGERALRYVSIVDDDNFPEDICDITAILPNSIKQMIGPTLVGTSQGLVCFYGSSVAVIWNPWIKKPVSIPCVVFGRGYVSVLGFGVCPKTSEPKLVKITYPTSSLEMQTWTWTVDILSFISGCWKSCSISKISNLLCKSLSLFSSSECVDKFIYWCAYNMKDAIWVVISFDMTNEEFGVIHLPDSFARYEYVDLSKHRESLVLLPHDDNISKYDYDVWIMEGDVTKSFKKLFTVSSTYDCVKTMAISYKGEAILEMLEDNSKENVISIDTYEPASNRFKWTKITAIRWSIYMRSYKETMLLHDFRILN